MSEPDDERAKVQSRCLQRVKTSLGRPALTPQEARDAFLDCIVVSYLEGVKAGVKGPVDAEADPLEVGRVAAGLLRRRLEDQGASFESPTREALSAATDAVDAELQFAMLPEAVRGTHEQVVSDLLAKATHSTETELIVGVLGRSELGKGLSGIERHSLVRYLHVRRFSEGEELSQRGSPADSTMLLVEGSVQVLLNDQKLAVLDPGDVFGESMFSEDATRSADVLALEEGSVAVLALNPFEAMLAEDNDLALHCRSFFEALYARNREKRGLVSYQDPSRYVALIAHNEMKSALVDFVRAHRTRLQRYPLIATGTTGTLLHRETGVTLSRKVKSGPLGGDQAVGSLISTGNILGVIFFRDPLAAHPHHADIEALGRLCDVYQIPFATNGSTAEAVLDHLERGPAHHERANPALEKYEAAQGAVLRKDG